MKNLIWYEKYRQKKLSQLALPEAQMEMLEQYVSNKEIPHLLFCGPPGSGKTTISRILIDKVAANKLMLNASSSDRGIDIIKNKVKSFAMSQRQESKLNVVFFDEADGLTTQAQDALKNTIESFHKNCRFIFTCNEIDKIISPIISRCIVFKLDTLPQDDLLRYIKNILTKEKIIYKTKDIKTITEQFYPDIRSVINNIQFCSVSGKLNAKKTLSFFDFKEIGALINKGKITALRNLWKDSINFLPLYKWLFNIWLFKVKEDLRPDIAIVIAEYLNRDKNIANKEINTTACILEIMNVLELEISFGKK